MVVEIFVVERGNDLTAIIWITVGRACVTVIIPQAERILGPIPLGWLEYVVAVILSMGCEKWDYNETLIMNFAIRIKNPIDKMFDAVPFYIAVTKRCALKAKHCINFFRKVSSRVILILYCSIHRNHVRIQYVIRHCHVRTFHQVMHKAIESVSFWFFFDSSCYLVYQKQNTKQADLR